MVDMEARERPKSYIDRTIDLLKYKTNPKILEIGCMRQPLNHDIDNSVCFGCMDGHSTYLWARTGWHVDCVDINRNHLDVAMKSCEKYSNVVYHYMDAMLLSDKITMAMHDLLFLDAWDLDVPGSAENHLEFYRKINPKLSESPMILIDDTDLYYDHEKHEYFSDPECLSGKGKLLIPELIKEGYAIVFKGRQTLLVKG